MTDRKKIHQSLLTGLNKDSDRRPVTFVFAIYLFQDISGHLIQ